MKDYESPLTLIEDTIYNEVNKIFEDNVLQVLSTYDIKVDKEELIKALKYDRNQYEKGYKDGLENVLYDMKNYFNNCVDFIEEYAESKGIKL